MSRLLCGLCARVEFNWGATGSITLIIGLRLLRMFEITIRMQILWICDLKVRVGSRRISLRALSRQGRAGGENKRILETVQI